jgi:uncharacterized protein
VPALSNTTSATRNSPRTDSDDNATDLRVTDPTPENSSLDKPACAVIPPVDEPETIAQIQGTSHISPFKGKLVNGVRGVVTAVGPTGYWVQSTTSDADPATSEGLFVLTNKAAATVRTGDDVTFDGSISEYRPGGGTNLTTTELTGPKVTIISSGNTRPDPVVLRVDRTTPQQVIEDGNPLNVEHLQALFRPGSNAIDFYESPEGMRVAVRDAKVVGATKSFGEMTVVPGQGVDAITTPRGGVLYAGYDHPNAMRVQLDDPWAQRRRADVGDSMAGDTVGVMDYSFNNPKAGGDRHAFADTGRTAARDHQAPVQQPAGGVDLQRREPCPRRPADQVRPPRRSGRAQPAEPGHPGAGGDPGQQRCGPGHHRRLNPDDGQADRRHLGGRWPDIYRALGQPPRPH